MVPRTRSRRRVIL